jgi:RHS repeat-associated protein
MVASNSYGGDAWTYSYDDGGYLLTATHGSSTWTYDHGPRGELRSVTQPGGLGQFSYGRDGLARLTSIEGTSPGLTFDYDALGRETVRPRGTATWNTSWSSGEGTTTLPNGDRVAVVYDGRGRVAGKTFTPGTGSVSGLSSVSYAYNGLDGLMKAEEAGVGGATTVYTHDERGFVKTVERDSSPTVSYGYRVSGKISSVTAGATTVTYGYDAQERVSSVTGAAGTVSVGWEPGGERLETLSGPAAYQRRCYDGVGRLTQVLNDASPVACGSTSPTLLAGYVYGYDGRGNRTSETYSSQGTSELTSYGYDASDRLTGVQYMDRAVVYQLARDGTRLAEKSAPYAAQLGPTGFDSLVGPTEHLAYHHDERGGLTSVTDDLSGTTVASYEVDVAGRVKSETRGAATRTYGWDAEGRLRRAAVSLPVAGGGAATSTMTYAYDHAGRRVSKSGSDGDATYLWGAGELVQETPALGSALMYQRVGNLAVAVGGEQILHDGLGGVAGRIGAGAPVLYRYDAWGGLRGGAPGAGEASLAYAGQHWDEDAGLSYAQQRWYDPRTGRFLSEDPVFGDLQRPNSLHAFGYANGNPMLYVDPLGTASLLDVFMPTHSRYTRRGEKDPDAAVDASNAQAVNNFTRRLAVDVTTPAGLMEYRGMVGRGAIRLQSSWNQHFEDEGWYLASHGKTGAGVTTATGGQFAGSVLFMVPNMAFNTGDVVAGAASIPQRAWHGCGQAVGGESGTARLAGAGECAGAVGDTLAIIAGAAEATAEPGPNAIPAKARVRPASGDLVVLRDTAAFLKEEGIGPLLRRQLLESGFQQRIGADTPISLARFRKLFRDTIKAGKALEGRLGDLDTRVATINRALTMERAGLRPVFEYPAGENFADLVGLDPATGRPVEVVQFAKEQRPGVWNEREVPSAEAIGDALGVSVEIVKTGEARAPR